MIPLNRPKLPSAEELLPYLKKIDESRHYTNFGPLQNSLVERLEEWFYKKTDQHFCVVTCSSATLGLEIAIASLGLKPGSHILIPGFTFIATATAVLRSGHIPIVGDVDLHSWLLTSQIADDALKQCKFEAVIPVATFGVPQNVLDWSQWSNHNKIPVIIDAAGGFGTQMPHKDITVVYSLHATKSLPAGEGGLIVSSDPKLARQLKNMTNFGIGNLANADYCPNSTNAKLSEFHSAVALAALNNFDEQQIIRKETLDLYKQNLKEIINKGISLQMPHIESPTIFNIICDTENQRNAIENSLNKSQIETRKWYQPFINKHPNLLSNIQSLQMTNSKMIENKIIGLPFYIDLKEEEIKYICIEIKKILR